jgi:hypothetical protein
VVVVRTFEELQAGLGTALALDRDGSRLAHVVVVLPSLNVSASVRAYYDTRLPTLEHRFLLSLARLGRVPGSRMVMVTSIAPDPHVWDYYLRLAARLTSEDLVGRAHLVTLDDASGRPLADALLDRPDLIAQIRTITAGLPGHIDPYVVTEAEAEVAVRLQLPINGSAPALAPLGSKTGARAIFTEVGVPVPRGVTGVRDLDGIVSEALALRRCCPDVDSVVAKLDNSASGVGNVVLALPCIPEAQLAAELRRRLTDLPRWFVEELSSGAVVEEHLAGARFASPSVQADIAPDGMVTIQGTHEQELGGPHRHTYSGCRFPADPGYAAVLGEYGRVVGEELARRGCIGRFSVDFAATWEPGRGWALYALEINLRQGGTSPPLGLLASLVPGGYEAARGGWEGADGQARCYRSTDNLVDPRWVGLAPERAIRWIADAGLGWDVPRRTGVVLHLMSCLAVDGRMGLTAIAATSAEADALFDEAVRALHRRTAPDVA